LAGDDDYLRDATSINHQVALRANFKIYSRSAKGGEKDEIGIGAYSKVNIKYFKLLTYDSITKIALF
jgi:hypothetical protein